MRSAKSTNSGCLTQRIALAAGVAALVGMGLITAGCSNESKEAPKPAETSSAPAVEPTQKAPGQKPIPSIAQPNTAACGPGFTKINGVCTK